MLVYAYMDYKTTSGLRLTPWTTEFIFPEDFASTLPTMFLFFLSYLFIKIIHNSPSSSQNHCFQQQKNPCSLCCSTPMPKVLSCTYYTSLYQLQLQGAVGRAVQATQTQSACIWIIPGAVSELWQHSS